MEEKKETLAQETKEAVDTATEELVSEEKVEPEKKTAKNALDKFKEIKEEIKKEEEEKDAITESPIIIKADSPLPVNSSTIAYIPVVIALTILGCVLGQMNFAKSGLITEHWLRYAYVGIGVLLLAMGSRMFIEVKFNSSIDQLITIGKLYTAGPYYRSRNPLYTSVMIFCSGCLLISGNTYFFILPIIYWGLLTVWMIHTEEKWLLVKFKDSYVEYKKETRRCFPWFSKQLRQK